MACIKFTRANGYYVGETTIDNGHFYGVGATIDKMIRNVKQSVWRIKGPGYRLYLDSIQSEKENMGIQWMPKRLKKIMGVTTKEEKMSGTTETPVIEEAKTKRTYNKQARAGKEYKYVEKNGILTIYEVIKIAEYKVSTENE